MKYERQPGVRSELRKAVETAESGAAGVLSHRRHNKTALSAACGGSEQMRPFLGIGFANHLILLLTICFFPRFGSSQIASNCALAGMTT